MPFPFALLLRGISKLTCLLDLADLTTGAFNAGLSGWGGRRLLLFWADADCFLLEGAVCLYWSEEPLRSRSWEHDSGKRSLQLMGDSWWEGCGEVRRSGEWEDLVAAAAVVGGEGPGGEEVCRGRRGRTCLRSTDVISPFYIDKHCMIIYITWYQIFL